MLISIITITVYNVLDNESYNIRVEATWRAQYKAVKIYILNSYNNINMSTYGIMARSIFQNVFTNSHRVDVRYKVIGQICSEYNGSDTTGNGIRLLRMNDRLFEMIPISSPINRKKSFLNIFRRIHMKKTEKKKRVNQLKVKFGITAIGMNTNYELKCKACGMTLGAHNGSMCPVEAHMKMLY